MRYKWSGIQRGEQSRIKHDDNDTAEDEEREILIANDTTEKTRKSEGDRKAVRRGMYAYGQRKGHEVAVRRSLSFIFAPGPNRS